MNRLPVKSSNIHSVGYDPATLVLEVQFSNGGVYQYPAVPPEMYEALLKSESIGRFVAQVIRKDRKGLRIYEEKAA